VTEEELVKILESNLTRLLQWISEAEARVSLVLGLDTAMLGALAVFAPSPKVWTLSAAALAAVAIAFLSLSLVFLATASFPRTTGPKQSMIYFGGIASRDLDQFVADTKSLTTAQYLDDLARQCHRNGHIAASKFEWLKRAQIALFLAISPWTLSLFLLYQIRP